MSPVLASTLALALYAIVLLPLAGVAIWNSNRTLSAGYAAFIVALAMYHTGIFSGSSLAETDMAVRAIVPGDDEQCQKIRDLMDQSGLRVDRSDLAAPRIVGEGAEQIPAEVRDVLIQCLDPQAPTEAGRTPADAALPIDPPFLDPIVTGGSER
jgi:hypothetical protein